MERLGCFLLGLFFLLLFDCLSFLLILSHGPLCLSSLPSPLLLRTNSQTSSMCQTSYSVLCIQWGTQQNRSQPPGRAFPLCAVSRTIHLRLRLVSAVEGNNKIRKVYVSERACGGTASWMGVRIPIQGPLVPASVNGLGLTFWISPRQQQGWLVQCLCLRHSSWHVARVISSLCSFSCSYEPRITNKNNLGSAVSPETSHLVAGFFILCFFSCWAKALLLSSVPRPGSYFDHGIYC